MARTKTKPLPNCFACSVLTGAIAAGAGANSEVFQFRWTSTTLFAVLLQLRCSGLRATTAFAVGTLDLSGTIARSWTVDGTGGATATLSGNNQKLRTSGRDGAAGTSLRVSSTAALGAGTKTFDVVETHRITSHSSGGVSAATPIIGSIYLPTEYFFRNADGDPPVVLAANEGYSVRATVPGTGVWNVGFDLLWAELTAGELGTLV